MTQRASSNAYRRQQRQAQADAQNVELEAAFAELDSILKDSLARDSYIDLDALKTAPRIERFKKAKPRRGNFLPSPPAGLNKMLPWKKREHELLCAEGEKRYQRAQRKYQRAKDDHETRMNLRRNRAIEENQKIERLQERFSAGESKAVEDYFSRVLQSSSLPERIPPGSQLFYTARSRQLTIERDLPTFEAIPDVKAYRYIKTRDEITPTALALSQRKLLYASILAQIPLRTIHEIYTADRTEKIDTIILSGFVETIHPGTGRPGRFCLVSVSTTRRQFLDLNLELVDPLECLKHLNGRISRKPEELIAIDPIEVIGDSKTPPTLARTVTIEPEPRRADEVYHRVSAPVAEDAAKDIPIPPRAQAERFSASFSRDDTHFVEQARAFVERTEDEAEPVPFQQYWPTYRAMDAAQQKWYFYWRAQLRRGKRLPTDLSYLFVHVYEAINLVGFESPQAAFEHLDEFWRFYRQLQPKLDRYLPDWIADFIVLHELAPNALKWYKDVSEITAVSDTNIAIEAWVASGASFDALPNATLFQLANYNPAKSKFYKQFSASADLDQGYKKALVAVDEAARRERGQSLFQLHQPKRRQVIRRAPFSSALHAYPSSEIEIAATHNWTELESLAAFLQSCVKHADNVQRELAGYRYRARGIVLSEKYRSIIEAALQPEAPRQELEIDHSSLARLAKDSEALRKRLLADAAPEPRQPEPEAATSVEEQFVAAASWTPVTPTKESAPEAAAAKPPLATAAIDWTRIGGRRKARAEMRLGRFAAATAARPADLARQSEAPAATVDDTSPLAVPVSGAGPDNGAQPASSGFLQRPEDTPDELLTDLAEVAHIMGEGDSKRSKLIAVMMAKDWECTADSIGGEFPGEFINVIIDEINNIALEEIGDTLIFEEDGLWIVLDEYRDEAEYILQHPEYVAE